MIIVLFGNAGAGKSYIGTVLEKNFGFFLHEGDNDLTEDMKQALKEKRVFDDSMRSVFFNRLIRSVKKIEKKYESIVVTQTFIKEKYRDRFLKQFSNASFFLVQTTQHIREKRILERKTQRLDRAYVRQMDTLFETPKIEHRILINDTEGKRDVVRQIKKILTRENQTTHE